MEGCCKVRLLHAPIRTYTQQQQQHVHQHVQQGQLPALEVVPHLPNLPPRYVWRVVSPEKLPSWLLPLQTTGEISSPSVGGISFDGSAVAVQIPFEMRSRDLQGAIDPYTTSVYVDIVLQAQFSQPIFTSKLQVYLYISAQACSYESAWEDAGKSTNVTLGKATLLQFTANDVDGLRVAHSSADGFFALATCSRGPCLPSSVYIDQALLIPFQCCLLLQASPVQHHRSRCRLCHDPNLALLM